MLLAAILALPRLTPTIPIEPDLDLLARGPQSIELGATAHLSLTVAPRGQQRLLEGGPFEVRVDGPAVEVMQPTYHRNDAVDPKADAPRFDIEVKAKQLGSATVTARVRLYLCAMQQCHPVEAHASWTIEVRAKP